MTVSGEEQRERAGGEAVSWVECPRDAWQGLPSFVPTERKAAHLNALLGAGFRRLDLGSFVSPTAVPQMADTEELLGLVTAPPDAELLCIVGNERGLDRAMAVPNVTSVGYPLSVNETFQRRNLGRSLAESWSLVRRLAERAAPEGLVLVVYLSMAFGNPYGDEWTPADTARALERLLNVARDVGGGEATASGLRVALADTVGTATAGTVDEVLRAAGEVADLAHVGLHLHSRPGGWRESVDAGLARGVRWFEGALGGIGGCPFAGDELVGNLPTEELLPYLRANGYVVQGAATSDDVLAVLTADAAAVAALGQAAG